MSFIEPEVKLLSDKPLFTSIYTAEHLFFVPGVKRQVVHCVERTFGIVEEHYCDTSTRPDDNRVSCNAGICLAV